MAGSVDTKYSGNYTVGAGRNAYGGWNIAVAGPYGGKVTRTLPSGYRTTTYHGRAMQAQAQDLQQKLAAAKQSAAANQRRCVRTRGSKKWS